MFDKPTLFILMDLRGQEYLKMVKKDLHYWP